MLDINLKCRNCFGHRMKNVSDDWIDLNNRNAITKSSSIRTNFDSEKINCEFNGE